jgi:hypothetical protein
MSSKEDVVGRWKLHSTIATVQREWHVETWKQTRALSRLGRGSDDQQRSFEKLFQLSQPRHQALGAR